MLKPPNKRNQRVADLIQRELALTLKKSIRDPRFSNVVITGVGMSRDLRWARIYFTLLDYVELSAVERALNHASGYFRHELAQNSSLRYTPQLYFCIDQTIIHSERIAEILKDLPPDDETIDVNTEATDHPNVSLTVEPDESSSPEK